MCNRCKLEKWVRDVNSQRDGVCYPVIHVLPTVTFLNQVETLRTGQHAPSGCTSYGSWQIKPNINEALDVGLCYCSAQPTDYDLMILHSHSTLHTL
jgi:hypothetical protein